MGLLDYLGLSRKRIKPFTCCNELLDWETIKGRYSTLLSAGCENCGQEYVEKKSSNLFSPIKNQIYIKSFDGVFRHSCDSKLNCIEFLLEDEGGLIMDSLNNDRPKIESIPYCSKCEVPTFDKVAITDNYLKIKV